MKKVKNKEKYKKEIMNIACSGDSIAVMKKSGRVVSCNGIKCSLCLFCDGDCSKEKIREWAESEYIEKPVISKRDRSFLDCLRDRWKYMARENMSNAIYMFVEIPKKTECGYSFTGEARRVSTDFNVVFPMVKWSDSEPWLIENLKKLEVVEGY